MDGSLEPCSKGDNGNADYLYAIKVKVECIQELSDHRFEYIQGETPFGATFWS